MGRGYTEPEKRSTGSRGTSGRGTASRGTAGRGTASRGTAGRGTASRGTASRGTASRGTASRDTASRGTSSRSRSSAGTTTRNTAGRSAASRNTGNRGTSGGNRKAPAGKTTARNTGTRGGNGSRNIKKKKPGKSRRRLYAWIEAFIEAAVIVFVLFFVLWPLKVDGVSMEPTLERGDRVLVSRTAAVLGFIGRGDLVICSFEDENGESVDAVRRVIGMPGEFITISSGVVSVNGTVLEEEYLPDGMETYPDDFLVLGKSEYFVMGDNRAVSGDSRAFGAVLKKNISAKIILRFSPFSKLKAY